MKRLVRAQRSSDLPRYPHDVARLQSVAAGYDYRLSLADAEWAWEQHSDTYAAGWLSMGHYTDADLLAVLRNYLVEDDDD